MSATLTIRGVAPETRDRLRARAARNGRSMAAEARAILDAARDDGPPETPDLAEAIRRRFAPFGGVELPPLPPIGPPEPSTFGS